jgi:hypothetical protein
MDEQKEAQVLEQILSCLSSKPYCGDFKQPVLSQHEELADVYLQVIKSPMDLGTILRKIQQKEYKSFRDCGADICLVFHNSLLFNALLPSLVSISSHGLLYAQRLWTNIYDLPIQLNETLDKFHQSKHSNRLLLYRSCRHFHISSSEWNRVATLLQEILSQSDLHSIDLPLLISQCETVTLSQYLNQVAHSISSSLSSLHEPDEQATPSADFRCAFLEAEIDIGDEWYHVASLISLNPSLASALSRLDRVVGEICTHLMERETRGHSMSSIWAHPHRLVWAQPNKSPWWPGMIIAGHDVPKHIETANLSRIPTQIMSALSRLQPKTKALTDPTSPSSSSPSPSPSQFSTPNLYLVEFFGTHDFGWVKASSVVEFVVRSDGTTPLDIPSNIITRDSVALSQALEAHGILANPEKDLTLAIASLPLEKYVFETRNFRAQGHPTPVASPMTASVAGSTGGAVSEGGKQPKKRKQPSCNSTSSAAGSTPAPEGASKRERALHQTRIYAARLQAGRQITCTLSSVPVPIATPALSFSPAAVLTPPTAASAAVSLALVPADETACYPPSAPFPSAAATLDQSMITASDAVEDSVLTEHSADYGSPPTKRKRRRKKATLFVDEQASKFLSTPLLSAQEKALAAFQGSARLVKHLRNLKFSSCPILHCREVNFTSPLFFLESRSKEVRKKRLRAEIDLIKRELQRHAAPTATDALANATQAEELLCPGSPSPPPAASAFDSDLVSLTEPMSPVSPTRGTAAAKSTGASAGIRVGLAGRGAKCTSKPKSPASQSPLKADYSSPAAGRGRGRGRGAGRGGQTSAAVPLVPSLAAPAAEGATAEEPDKSPAGNSLAMSMMPFSGK